MEAILRVSRFWPLALFVALTALFGVGLTLNPRDLPSALLDRPVPQFALAAVKGRSAGADRMKPLGNQRVQEALGARGPCCTIDADQSA